MANDLRDPKYQAQRPAVPGKNGGKSPTVSMILIVVGIILMSSGVGFLGGVIFLIAGIVGLSSAKKQAAAKPAAKKPAQPARGPEICDNPEPHRHFEAKEPCDNRENHSHYDEKRTPSGKRWPTAREKRLLNMRHLYEAGLLTREEYDDEVRKLKNG